MTTTTTDPIPTTVDQLTRCSDWVEAVHYGPDGRSSAVTYANHRAETPRGVWHRPDSDRFWVVRVDTDRGPCHVVQTDDQRAATLAVAVHVVAVLDR